MPVYDRLLAPVQFVEKSAPSVAPPDTGTGYAIAVVGTGPRGISILERLGARLAGQRPAQPLTIYAIDADEVGSGRVWRSGQPRWMSMNNRCGEVTMFSGPADDGAWRPGAGPTFAEWWQRTDARFPGPDAYAPRSLYGRYLRFVLDVVETNLPPEVELVRVPGLVSDVAERDGRFALTVGDRVLDCDRVAICSGHPREQQRHPALTAGTRSGTVGILGLGLTFHDVVATLTVGRGGRFAGRGKDTEYVPSGDEPELVVAGSRSAWPIPARGSAQTAAAPDPRLLFTPERISGLRSAGPVDFRADVLPWLEAEVDLAYWRRSDPEVFADLERRLPDLPDDPAEVLPALRSVAADLGCAAAPTLEDLARPFRDRLYPDQAAFRADLLRALGEEVDEAGRGEVDGALKGAMEMLRRVRPTVRSAVDLGGLTAASHKDFVERIGPMLAFLSTGPSAVRTCQLMALIRAGVLEILGPQARFTPRDDGFLGRSAAVAGYNVRCADVVDARIRPPDLERDAGVLARSRRAAGAWRPHVRAGNPAFRTGGVDVTDAPFHPIAADGTVDRRMYVLGIPTESTRWFMQVGIGRPGPWGEFVRDADAIARSALREVRLTPLPEPAPAGTSPDLDDPALNDMDYCFTPTVSRPVEDPS